MSNIPGLSICPVDDGNGAGIEIPSFTENIFVPESHRHGNCRTVSEFERLATIAEGSFGILYKCRDRRTKELYALKKFKMPSDLQDGFPSSILREINVLNTLKHANIICSHGTVAGKSLENNYLILDYCVFSLKELIERNVESIYEKAMVKHIMQQLFYGLEYIHGGLIIHRDICSKNIMFNDKGVLKITGFYASRFHAKGNMTPGVTEIEYRAPELLFQSKLYGPAVDMWSAGCVFAKLLLKRPLFTGSSEIEVFNSICNVLGSPSEAIWPGFTELFSQLDFGNRIIQCEKPFSELKNFFDDSSATKDLLLNILIYFPPARLGAQQCLKSPYFSETPNASTSDDLASILKGVVSDVPVEVNN